MQIPRKPIRLAAHMRPSILLTALFAAAFWAPSAASAAGVRVLSADERGVTLRVDTERWSLSAPDAVTGRATIVGVPMAHSLSSPGRALLPTYTALLAIPPDARPSLRVLERGDESVRGGVRLAIAGRPGFQPDPPAVPKPRSPRRWTPLPMAPGPRRKRCSEPRPASAAGGS